MKYQTKKKENLLLNQEKMLHDRSKDTESLDKTLKNRAHVYMYTMQRTCTVKQI